MLLAKAEEAAHHQDWRRVKELTRQILEIEPGHPQADSLMSHADQQLAPATSPPLTQRTEQPETDVRCAWCSVVIAPHQERCPHCDRLRIDHATRRTPGGPPVLAIVWGVFVGALAVVGLGALVLFRLSSENASFLASHPVPDGDQWVGAGPAPIPAADCPGTGQRVCLLAIGDPPPEGIEAIAERFTANYEITLTVLPPIEMAGLERESGELVDHERQQLYGDLLVEALKTIYPEVWLNPEVTLIALTQHDIYDSRNPDFDYLYSVRGLRPGRIVLVSNARMDDAAWSGEADDDLLMERTRKLIAREIGAVHYGLSFRNDPTSVMTSVFGSRAGVDRATERLPLEELTERNSDLVLGTRHWRGVGRGETDVFEIEPGVWEYCAVIAEGGVGLRASLYTDSGVWLNSVSGAGPSGALPCQPIPGPGRYQVRLYASPDDAKWELGVAKRGVLPDPEVRLPVWSTDMSVRLTPASSSSSEISFDEPRGGFTPWFRPISDTWEICVESYLDGEQAPADEVRSSFNARLLIEHEWGDIASWEFRDFSDELNECVEVPNSQPHARHWVLYENSSEIVQVRLTFKNVELVD